MENKKTTLYIIQGFIGAGKSTFSKKLALETGAIHLNPDEWVTKLYEKEVYMNNWQACFDATLNELWKKTKDYLNNGNDVIFDMGFWKRKDRDYARNIAVQCKANCKHYYLFVPDEILKERIIANRPPEWAKIHLENFDKNKTLFEIPQKDEDVIVINNYGDKNLINYLNCLLDYNAVEIDEKNIEELYDLCKGNDKYYSYLKEEVTLDSVKSILTDLPPNVTIDNKHVIGFYNDNKLVAVLDLISNYPNTDKAFIGLFMLSTEYQGRKIGKQIIQQLLQVLKKLNYVSCHIGVIDSNIEAINF